jgi:uncharacterized protein DUF2867
MRASAAEYRGLHLRAHELLHGVPLEDVWAIPLQGGGPGRTIQEVSAIGARFGWDRPRPAWNADSYVHRLTAADRARSTVEPGTLDGRFGVLYRFENEQLSELRNSTVHGFVSLSLRPTADGYLAYLAIFVKPVHRFTPLYMTAIAPFRRLVVYPVIIRAVQREWARRHGKGR